MGWTARFIPQMWVNDYAVDVDPLSETDWEITEQSAAEALDRERRGLDRDYLRDDPAAPEWVREWPGPFVVELISLDGETRRGV